MRTPADRLKLLLDGGASARYHTQPYMPKQTVADHTYRMLAILLAYMPGGPSDVLMRAALCHDVAECMTCDMPSPFKLANPECSKIVAKAERDVLVRAGLWYEDLLNDHERAWLRAADWLELAMFARDQFYVGNRGAIPVFDAISKAWTDYPLDWPTEAEALMGLLHAEMVSLRTITPIAGS